MNNYEIRLRILHSLYQKYYSGGSTGYFNRDEIITEANLKNIDQNLVEGDLVYLVNSGMIEGHGRPYPAIIKIQKHGIDILENFVTNHMNNVTPYGLDLHVKQEIEAIKKEENVTSKIKKLYNFIIARPELAYAQEVLRVIFSQ